MSFIVRVTMQESSDASKVLLSESIHVDGQYEFENLEMAREAAEVACRAAADLNPRRRREIDDDEWKFHPDRTDD
jgi:hypothetical protein